MPLPDAVREQAENAERLWQRLYQSEPAEGQANVPGEASPAPQEPEPAPAAEVSPEPAGEPAVAQPEPSEPVAGGDAELWRRRFETADGIAKAAGREVRELRERVAELERLVARPVEKSVQPESPAAPDLLSSLEEETGLDRNVLQKLIEASAKVAEGRMREPLAEVQKKLASTSDQSFWDRVMKDRPDYLTAVRYDQEFHHWIDTKVPYSRQTFRDALNEAYSSSDAERFLECLDAYPGWKPAQPTPAAPQANKKLEAMVQPRPGAAGASQPAQKPVLTRAHLVKLNEEVGRLMRTQSPLDRKRAEEIQADIDRAWNEKRVDLTG